MIAHIPCQQPSFWARHPHTAMQVSLPSSSPACLDVFPGSALPFGQSAHTARCHADLFCPVPPLGGKSNCPCQQTLPLAKHPRCPTPTALQVFDPPNQASWGQAKLFLPAALFLGKAPTLPTALPSDTSGGQGNCPCLQRISLAKHPRCPLPCRCSCPATPSSA